MIEIGNPKSALLIANAFVAAMLAAVAAIAITNPLAQATTFTLLFFISLTSLISALVIRIRGPKEYEHNEPTSKTGRLLLNTSRIVIGIILIITGAGFTLSAMLALRNFDSSLFGFGTGIYLFALGLYGFRAGLRGKISNT